MKTRIELMDLDDLFTRRHHGNPKRHDIAALAQSFRRFGFVAPPTLDESSGVIVAGHGRCETLVSMRAAHEAPPKGVTAKGTRWLVPVLRGIAFDNDDERDAYLIADNSHVMRGGWDHEALAKMIDSMRIRVDDVFAGIGLDDLSAFADQTRAAITETMARPAKEYPPRIVRGAPIAEDEVPKPPRKAITKTGDLYRFDNGSVLVCGDCTDVMVHQRITDLELNGRWFGLTSPPYNAGTYLGKGGIAKTSRYQDTDDTMDDDAYADLIYASTRWLIEKCEVSAVNLQSLAANKRIIARWAGKFADHLIDRVVWVKSNAAPAIATNVLTSKFEDVYLYASKTRPNRTITTAHFRGDVPNVVETRSAGGANEFSDVHSATMSIPLAQWVLEGLAANADIVVDPFGGVGTTAVVASSLGKRFVLVELSPSYCDVIVERMERVTGCKAIRSQSNTKNK